MCIRQATSGGDKSATRTNTPAGVAPKTTTGTSTAKIAAIILLIYCSAEVHGVLRHSKDRFFRTSVRKRGGNLNALAGKYERGRMKNT